MDPSEALWATDTALPAIFFDRPGPNIAMLVIVVFPNLITIVRACFNAAPVILLCLLYI